MRQAILYCLLFTLYFLAIGLDVLADAINPGAIPPPKCGSPTCQCGCNSGEDCRCALPE